MDEMTCINTKHLAEKVKEAFTICNNNANNHFERDCSKCPYGGIAPCGNLVRSDAIAVINGYQEQLDYVVSVNEKNAARAVGAELAHGFLKGFSDELEKENRELKEDNARLVEQNKKLLEKEIENTRLRNENQTIRDDNKYLDERNDKLCDELRYRDRKMRDLLEEIDRQNKELYHHREWERLVRSQPMILHTEPVKIERVDVNVTKVAKAANKAAKSLDDAVKALNKLNEFRIEVPSCLGVPENRIRAMFGLPPYNPNPQEIAKEGDVLCMDRESGGAFYREVQYVNVDGIYDRIGCVRPRAIHSIYRKDENGNLKLIWKRN